MQPIPSQRPQAGRPQDPIYTLLSRLEIVIILFIAALEKQASPSSISIVL